MSEQTILLVERLRRRLRRAVRRITLADLAFGLVVVLGIAAAVWTLSVAVEAGLWLAPTPRSVLVGGGGLLLTGLVAYLVATPLLRLAGVLPDLSDEAAARRVGTRFPNVSDRLLNLIQLASGRRSDAPPALVDRAVRSLAGDVEPVPFEDVEDFGRARRAARLASVPLVGLLAFLLIAPGAFLGASQRLLAPATSFQKPAPFQLSMAPGPVELVKGDPLTITVRAAGETLPAAVTLAMQNEGEEAVEEIELRSDERDVFRHTVPNVRTSLRYRASARPVATAWHTATVTERPLVRRLQLTLQPPRYTGLSARTLNPNVGDVTALPGTRVSVEMQLGGPAIEHALLRFSGGRQDTLAVEGDAATGTFTLMERGSYQIALESARGVGNREPITYRLETRADAAPSISFLAPEATTTLGDDLRAPLRVRLIDDFGFSQLRLYYRLAESRYGEPMDDFAAIDLPLDQPRLLDQEVLHDWVLTRSTALDPVPGDVIEYYVQVRDNDRVAGFKSARTRTQRLTLASLAEQYETLDEQQRAVEQQMEGLAEQEENVREQFDQLKQELRRKPEADWEDTRQVDQLQEQQQQLEENVEQLQRQIESVTEQMEENQLASPETVELYEELREVAEEINSPEMQEALKKLQEAMQNLDRRQTQEAMENFEFNEEQYKERLERTLDLFKQLRTQQQLEEAARRAEELAQQQKRLSEETGKLNEQQGEQQQGEQQQGEQQQGEQQQGGEKTPEETAAEREQLAEEQERARAAMEQFEKKMEQLQEQMKETRRAPQKEMEQLTGEMKKQQLPQQMQKNSEQLQQGKMQEAQQGQQQMQQQLQQMQQKLQQMQQGMQGQQKQINMAGLRQALADVLMLSQDQEALGQNVRGLTSGSPALRRFTRAQSELATGLRTVSDSLQRLARDIPQMTRAVQKETGEALREMEAATETMTSGTAQQAGARQKASMTHLNELALLLSSLLDQMQNAQGQPGGGMSAQQMAQQMQQMAGQQQKLNGQIQQFLNDMQGERLSVGQQQRLQQMAEQQQAIQRQLEQLRRQGADRKMLGDLGKVAEQMGQTIDELRRQRPNSRTNQRQQQILTRMLDAQRSLQTRNDKERRREGEKAGDDYRERPNDETTRARPADLPPQEEAERLRRDLLRALESGYAPDYEDLIKRYFELLQQSEQGGQQTPQP